MRICVSEMGKVVVLASLMLTGACPWRSQAATLVVTNTNDNGAGSLRAALFAVTDGDIITFAANVTGSITLTNGELPVDRNISIVGPGPSLLAINGNSTLTNRVFEIIANNTVSISGLAITNGTILGTSSADAQGGGILNSGTLTLSNCVVSGNGVQGGTGNPPGNGLGGGIASSGALTLIASSFASNIVVGGYGSTTTLGPGGDGDGGAIYVGAGNLVASACTFNGNTAYGGNGGGNTGSGFGPAGSGVGGGIFSSSTGTLSLTN